MSTSSKTKTQEAIQADRWRELKYTFYLFKQSPLFVLGAIIIIVFITLAVFAPVLAPYDVNRLNPFSTRTPPLSADTGGA